LKVVILTLVFLIFQLLIDMVPGLAKKYSRFEKTDLFKVGSSREKTLTQDDAEEISGNLSRSRRELGMVLWVLMMLVFTYILGLLIAIPLYTFLYLKVRSGEGWFISLTMTAGVWGVLYGGFILILSVSLFEGHLWRWIGI